MAVSEQARGKQVGLLLGESIIGRARDRGFQALVLESNRKLTPAISLYRKLGFAEKPFPDPSVYSRADIYMELSL
jgi:GNAT superfamily N-acetyltransferase